MTTQISIGYIEWIRNQEYGVLNDYILKAQVFFHLRRNPNIHALSERSICLYQIQPSSKRAGLEAIDITLIEAANKEDLSRIVHGNLKIFLPLNALPIILKHLPDESRERLINGLLQGLEHIDEPKEYTEAVRIITLLDRLADEVKRPYVEKIEILCSPTYKLKLFLEGHSDIIDILALRAHFLTSLWDRNTIVQRLPSAALLTLYLSLLEDEVRIIDLPTTGLYYGMLNRSKSWPSEQSSELMDRLWQISSDSVHLQLWLGGYSDRFDLATFRLQFLLLSPEEQFLFIRRLMRDHEIGKSTLTIATLKALIRFENEDIKGQNIDCSIDITIQAIIDLSEGNPLSVEHQIGPVLAKHFSRKSFEKYQIKELFDRCEGRGEVSSTISPSIKGPPDIQYNRSSNVPSGVTYCEGRKAPSLDRTHGVEFWFCRNVPCFMPCNKGHEAPDWEKYTLRDFLRVLQIPFDEEQYQTFLGYINRCNDLLAHLNCRSCKRILTPTNQSNFAFYRATRFHCTNPECADNAEVYLNHCLHPRCGKVVDSRDAARCPNGLHVCPNCFSCCSTAKFGQRLQRLGDSAPASLRILVEKNGGHLENGMHFCFKCGSELIGGNEKFRQTLNWLIKNSPTDKRILKATRGSKGWFFEVDFPEIKYSSLKSMGFAVERMNGNRHLLSEPRGRRIFTLGRCPNVTCERHKQHCQPNF